MSRHRNYRNYAYEEDMCEDVYGHSVDEAEFALSPCTEEQFLYRRHEAHEPKLSAFIEEPYNEESSEESEEEDSLTSSKDYKRPQLDPTSEAKLLSCLDQLRSILGDDCHEETAVEAVMNSNYDVEKALDQMLNKSEKKSSRKSGAKAQKGPIVEERPSFLGAQVEAAEKAVSCAKPVVVSVGPVPAVLSTAPSIVSGGATASFAPVKVAAVKEKAVTGFVTPDVTPKKTNISPMDVSAPLECEEGLPMLDDSFGVKSKPKSKKINVDEEIRKRQHGKDLINLVVIGHVDAGKSTLMGHILFKLGHVPKRTMHKYEQESKKVGKASFAYAWVLDETEEERERGVTMDVGLTKFETDHKFITLMDAPGHRDFIPNMIQGAAQADVAIMVINATTGEFEAGFESGGQTREHALLVRSLGVQQLVVAINKLDTVKWSQDRYKYIVNKLGQFLKQAGFKEGDVSFVPCSGLTGENLTERSKSEDLRSWYEGPCIVEQIDLFKPTQRPIEKPFRLCVGDVYKGVGSGINVSGKLEAGSIQNGDKILVMPSGKQGLLKGLSIHDENVIWACAGDHAALTISGIDITDVNPGYVLCSPKAPIRSTTKLKARIIVFDIEVPITRGFMVLFHYQTLSEPATIKKLNSLLHKSTGAVVQKKPRCLGKHANAEVEIHTARPICIELYKDFKDLGRFMLRYGGKTIAAGVVTEIL